MPDVCRTIAWQREWKTFRHNIVVNSSVNGEPIIVGPFKDLVPNVRNALDTAKFESVSCSVCTQFEFIPQVILNLQKNIAIAIGLIVMMWPVLTKFQYETLPANFPLSIILNWIVGPFMLGLALCSVLRGRRYLTYPPTEPVS